MIKNICNIKLFNDNIDIDNSMKLLILLSFIFIFFNKMTYLIIIIFIIIIINIDIKRDIIKDKKICRNSTIDNPFSNILITTDLDKLKVDKCDIDEETINKNVEYNQYFNAIDLLKNKNNNRVHISYITKYPNNINNYIDYIYNLKNLNCKNDSYNCGKNNNLKFDKYNYV
jgi:hypothetical protein